MGKSRPSFAEEPRMQVQATLLACDGADEVEEYSGMILLPHPGNLDSDLINQTSYAEQLAILLVCCRALTVARDTMRCILHSFTTDWK